MKRRTIILSAVSLLCLAGSVAASEVPLHYDTLPMAALPLFDDVGGKVLLFVRSDGSVERRELGRFERVQAALIPPGNDYRRKLALVENGAREVVCLTRPDGKQVWVGRA